VDCISKNFISIAHFISVDSDFGLIVFVGGSHSLPHTGSAYSGEDA
jgi:hypothetical protein